MKLKLLFILCCAITLSFSAQNYIQSTTSSSGLFTKLTHNGGLLLGDQPYSNTALYTNTNNTAYPLQIFTSNPTQSIGTVLGNGTGGFQFTVAGGNGAYHPIATACTGVIRKLGAT